MENTKEKLKRSQEFLDRNGIHPHALISDCNGSRKIAHKLLEEFHNQQSISQKETIERLREGLKELVCIVKIHSKATKNNFAWAELEEAEQLLKETEPIDQ